MSESVNYMKDKRKRKCFRCGEEGHYTNRCSMKDDGLKCRYCYKSNHTTKECFKKKKDEKNKKDVKHIEEEVEDEAEFSVPMVKAEKVEKDLSGPTHMINQIRHNAYKIGVKLDGGNVSMEIDTGSGVPLLSRKDFESIDGDVRSLKPSKLILRGYSGGTIGCLGEKTMKVEMGDQEKETVVCVVDGVGPSLMGRDLISIFKLPWENIFKVNSEGCQELFQKYSELFDDSKIGMIKGVKVQLHVSDSTPIFRKARPVPYTIRTKYKETLDKLEQQGIIEKIEYSEWASPVVPVIKSNGDIRLWGLLWHNK